MLQYLDTVVNFSLRDVPFSPESPTPSGHILGQLPRGIPLVLHTVYTVTDAIRDEGGCCRGCRGRTY